MLVLFESKLEKVHWDTKAMILALCKVKGAPNRKNAAADPLKKKKRILLQK